MQPAGSGRPSFEIVTTPTLPWLRENFARCESRVSIASAYLNEALVDLLADAGLEKRTRLLTRARAPELKAGVSSFPALQRLFEAGAKMASLGTLHAKVYVVDARAALVTSANATYGGLRANIECGLAVRDGAIARELDRLVGSDFDSERPATPLNAAELARLRYILDHTAVAEEPAPAEERAAGRAGRGEENLGSLVLEDRGAFLERHGGWRRLTLECVLDMPKDRFTLRDFYGAALPRGRKQFPRNTRPEAKLRQQLQQLRDIGLLVFEEPGHYRRLVR